MQTIRPVSPQNAQPAVRPRSEAGAPSFIKNVSGINEGDYSMDTYVPGFSESATILPKHAENGGIRNESNPYGKVVMGRAFVGGGEGIPPTVQNIAHRMPSRKPIAGVDVKMDEDVVAVVDPTQMMQKAAAPQMQQQAPEPMYQYENEVPQYASQAQPAPRQTPHQPAPRQQAPVQQQQQQYYAQPPAPSPQMHMGAAMAMNQPGMPQQQQYMPPHMDMRGSTKVYNPPPQQHYPQQHAPAPDPVPEVVIPPMGGDYINIPKKRIRVRISHEKFGNYRGNYVYVMENDRYLVLFYDVEDAGYEPPTVSTKEEPMIVSCEGKEHKVYYLGMDFDLNIDNLAMQIYCKKIN